MYRFKGKTVAKLAALLIAGGLGGAGINALHNVATYGNTVTVAHADATSDASAIRNSMGTKLFKLEGTRGASVSSLASLDTAKTGLTGIYLDAPNLEASEANTQKIQALIDSNKSTLEGVAINAPLVGTLDLSGLAKTYSVSIVNTQLISLDLTGLNSTPKDDDHKLAKIAVVANPLMSPDYLKGIDPAKLTFLSNETSNPEELTIPTVGHGTDSTPYYVADHNPTGRNTTPTNLIIGAKTYVGIPYISEKKADDTVYRNEPQPTGSTSVPAGTVYERQKDIKPGDLLFTYNDSTKPKTDITNLARSYQIIYGGLLGTDAAGNKVVTDIKDIPLAKLMGQIQTQTGGGAPQALTDDQKKSMTLMFLGELGHYFTYDQNTQTIKFTGDKDAFLAHLKDIAPDTLNPAVKMEFRYVDAASHTDYTGVFAVQFDHDVAPTPSTNGGGGSTTNNGGNSTNPVTYPTVTGQTGLGTGVLVLGTNVREGQAVYATRGIYLYSNPTFSKKYQKVHYNKQRRVNRPMFVVTGYTYSKNGALRYKVKDVNHTWKSDGKTGYITASTKYVVPVYYTSLPKSRVITVIKAHGINAYKSVNLKGKATHYKKGRHLRVVKVVKHNLTSRYVLSNGQYITANKKLIIAGNY